MENRDGGAPNFTGALLERAKFFDPATPVAVPVAPHALEHPLGPLHLLNGGRQGLAPLGQVRDVAHEKPADPPMLPELSLTGATKI